MFCRAAHKATWLAIPDPILDFKIHLMHACHGDILHLGRPLAVYRIATTGSMVSESSAHVRSLYWEAIRDVPRELVNDEAYALAVTDFLRRVLFRAIRSGDLRLFTEWAERVYAESPYGKGRTMAMTLANATRMLSKMAVSKLPGLGSRFALYRR